MKRLIPAEQIKLFRKHNKYPERGGLGDAESTYACGLGIHCIDIGINPHEGKPKDKLFNIPDLSHAYLQGYWRGFDGFPLYKVESGMSQKNRVNWLRTQPEFLQGLKDGRDLAELCRIEFPGCPV